MVYKYAEKPKYFIHAVAKRRKKLREMAIKHAGGKCMQCGYNKYPEVLEFHHKDPSQKSFGIGQRGLTRSWTRIKEEIKKCKLLCANCHREEYVKEKLRKQRRVKT